MNMSVLHRAKIQANNSGRLSCSYLVNMPELIWNSSQSYQEFGGFGNLRSILNNHIMIDLVLFLLFHPFPGFKFVFLSLTTFELMCIGSPLPAMNLARKLLTELKRLFMPLWRPASYVRAHCTVMSADVRTLEKLVSASLLGACSFVCANNRPCQKVKSWVSLRFSFCDHCYTSYGKLVTIIEDF